MEDFKGNSYASKEEPIAEKSEPVVTNVTVKKQSDIAKFGRSIISEDASNVGKKILSDIVVPNIKKFITDVGTNFINWIVYGVKGAPTNKTSINGLSRISYDSMYSRSVNNAQPVQKATLFMLDEVQFDELGDAELVVLKLKEKIARYGMVSAGEFYDMVGQPSVFTAQKYGWRDLSTATIGRKNDKYIINFPRLSQLE